ncbi:MAG: hypothetical protein AB7N76_03710 [Planctomycetota bacterium]
MRTTDFAPRSNQGGDGRPRLSWPRLSSLHLSWPHLSLALLLLAALAAPAHAEGEDDGGDQDAARAIMFPGRLGLTGFQDMVDARTPKRFAIRGGIQYDVLVQDQDFGGAYKVQRELEQHELGLYVGASALGMIDVSARMPWVYRHERDDLRGLVDRVDRDHGWGDFDLAGKVSLAVGPIVLAPYLNGRFPTGEPQVKDLLRFEYGASATFSLFNDYLSVHGNVAGLTKEKGFNALIFRAGASFVVWSDAALLVRVYGYGDGIEYGGRADTDLDLEFGAQALLFGIFTAELGFSTRLIDAGYIDDSTKRFLRQGLNTSERHFADDGTWSVHLALGVTFGF